MSSDVITSFPSPNTVANPPLTLTLSGAGLTGANPYLVTLSLKNTPTVSVTAALLNPAGQTQSLSNLSVLSYNNAPTVDNSSNAAKDFFPWVGLEVSQDEFGDPEGYLNYKAAAQATLGDIATVGAISNGVFTVTAQNIGGPRAAVIEVRNTSGGNITAYVHLLVTVTA